MAETTTDAPETGATTAAMDTSGPADIAPATTFTPAGAPDQVTEIDVDHPAVDNNPRARTTVDMNRIDFNDPSLDGADAVAKNLGMKTAEQADAEAAKAAKPKA